MSDEVKPAGAIENTTGPVAVPTPPPVIHDPETLDPTTAATLNPHADIPATVADHGERIGALEAFVQKIKDDALTAVDDVEEKAVPMVQQIVDFLHHIFPQQNVGVVVPGTPSNAPPAAPTMTPPHV